MSNTRGIFESFGKQPSPAAQPAQSPFAIAPEPTQAPSPFGATAKGNSPFAVVAAEEPEEDPKTIRIPEKRKAPESPFQVAEPQGFGFEATPQSFKAAPFEAPASQQPKAPSPFATEQPAAPTPAPAPVIQPATAFAGWPATEPAPSPAPAQSSQSDSFSIKQLELRAIFRVDREMPHEEILQRARSLPGIKHIARVGQQDINAVETLKQIIANLGFGGGNLKLYSGSVPIEFIREGTVLLAVQTDGGFAPGVRETLMIVARELGR